MSGKYTILTPQDKENLVTRFSPFLPVGYQHLSLMKVLEGTKSFYPDWTYYVIEKQDNSEDSALSLFTKEEEVIALDWQPRTLLSFNATAPLSLSLENVVSYVRFFFEHVRLQEGNMTLLESYDDLAWREEPAGRVKQALHSLISSPRIISWDDESQKYELDACLLFERNLFSCRLNVSKGGEINITDRHLMVEDIPVLDESEL